jgi:hypothetical protein
MSVAADFLFLCRSPPRSPIHHPPGCWPRRSPWCGAWPRPCGRPAPMRSWSRWSAGPAAHLGVGRGRGRRRRRGRRPGSGQTGAALRLDRGLAHPHRWPQPWGGREAAGPGQGVDRSAHPHPPGLVDGTVSPEQADVIVRSVQDLPSGELVRRRGEKAPAPSSQEPGRLRPREGRAAPGRGGRPRRRRPPPRSSPGP